MNSPKGQKELKELGAKYQAEIYPLIYEGKLKEAIESGRKALDIFTELADKRQMAQSLNLISIAYTSMGNNSMDIECILEGLDICLDNEVYDIGAKLLNNIGSKFMMVKDYENALQYFNRSMEAFETACDIGLTCVDDSSYFICILNLNLSLVCSISGDLIKTRQCYEKAKVLAARPENADITFLYKAFEGLILWRLNDPVGAKKTAEETLQIAIETEYSPDYMETMSYLIELLKEMEDYENLGRAIDILDEHLKEHADRSMYLEVLNYRADYYKALGDAEKYRETCIQYFEYSREQVTQANLRTATEIETKAEMFNAIRAKKKADSIVFTDTLTQIGNRNRMLEDSKCYIKEALKNRSPIAVGLIDIDFFKECNDTYGHISGDNCLKIVAEVIKEAVADAGSVYRYGGDEFLLLLPNATEESLNVLGAAIKTSLDARDLPNPQSPISQKVTISQGYTMAYPDDGDNIEWLIGLADKALYAVKRSGKNNYRYIHFNDIIASS